MLFHYQNIKLKQPEGDVTKGSEKNENVGYKKIDIIYRRGSKPVA